jgi:hypothetical protein
MGSGKDKIIVDKSINIKLTMMYNLCISIVDTAINKRMYYL